MKGKQVKEKGEKEFEKYDGKESGKVEKGENEEGKW